MTKRTLSRSARGTPKTEDEPVTNGTPLIDHNSGTISVPSQEEMDVTGWTIQFGNGTVQHVRVKGGRGRISYSSAGRGGAGEVRVYRNETTKVFDAVFTGVTAVVSDRVETIPVKDGDAVDLSVPRFHRSSWSELKAAQAKLNAKAKAAPPREWVPLNPEDFK